MKISCWKFAALLVFFSIVPTVIAQAQTRQTDSACDGLAPGSIVRPISFQALALRLKQIPSKRGEFETTKSFDDRVAAAVKGLSSEYVLEGEVSLDDPNEEFKNSLIHFPIPFSYDPDKQIVTITDGALLQAQVFDFRARTHSATVLFVAFASQAPQCHDSSTYRTNVPASWIIKH